jgi:hypothetical protein
MPEPTLDNQMLVRRTLVTMGVMVGACVVVVGTLTIVASTIVGHAAQPIDSSDAGSVTTPAAATAVHPGSVGLKPTPAAVGPQKK